MIRIPLRSRVTCLRFLLAPLNLLLGISLLVAWYAHVSGGDDLRGVDVSFDPDFGNRRASVRGSLFDARGLAIALLPTKAKPREIQLLPPPPPPPPSFGDQGPLADAWEYSMFIGTADGKIAMVQLRRTAEKIEPSPKRARRPKTQRMMKPWTFFVADRVIREDKSELEIVAHSANASGFKYSVKGVDDGPWVLPFVAPPTAFLRAPRTRVIDE